MLCIFGLSKEHLRYVACSMEMTQTVICTCWRQALMFNCFMDMAFQSNQSNNRQNDDAHQNLQETKGKWDIWFIPVDVWNIGSKLVQILYHRHQSPSLPPPLCTTEEEKEIYLKIRGVFDSRESALMLSFGVAEESPEQSIHGCPERWWQVQEGAWWFIAASSSVDRKTM